MGGAELRAWGRQWERAAHAICSLGFLAGLLGLSVGQRVAPLAGWRVSEWRKKAPKWSPLMASREQAD